MTVRPAAFGNDVINAADVLFRKARGKTTARICRSRVDQCIRRARARGQGFRAALVAVDGGDASTVRGFLYAEERQLFDLCPNVRVVEVPFLAGSHGAAVPMLKRLREMTKARIMIQSWAMVARPAALRRLLRPLSPQQVAVVYQV